jgi:glycerol uptake facilitator-like aquaporin
MNPARTLGPALYAGPAALSHYWVYVAGPLIGAIVASRTYEALRGGEEFAKDAPDFP